MNYFGDLNSFHFLRPYWFFALLPVLILLWRLAKKRSAGASWQNLIHPDLLPLLLLGEEKSAHRFPLVLLTLVWLITVIALAGPVWQQLPQAVKKRMDAQVLVLDLSLSMLATDIAPNRAARAKHKLMDILKYRQEGLTGLVVYSGDAHVVSPLTDDTQTILSLAPSLGPELMSVPGSNAAAALSRALELLQNAQSTEGSILFITDGIEEEQIPLMEQALANTPYRLSLLGVGTAKGAPIKLPGGDYFKDKNHTIVIPTLNRDPLISLCKGQYSDLSNDDSDIKRLMSTDNTHFKNDQYQETQRQFDLWQEEGPWLVLLLLPFASLAFRRGWLGLLLLGLLSFSALSPSPAHAMEWSELWQTPDQKGQKLYNKGEYESAAKTFNTPEWKASSFYKGGNFEAAYKEFAKKNDADALYNQANAQAKAGQLEAALSLYEKALEMRPDNKDTQFNRDLVKKLLEQQKQNNAQSPNQDGKQADKPGENSSQQENATRDNAAQNKSSEGNPSEQKTNSDDTQSPSSDQNTADSQKPSEQQNTPSNPKSESSQAETQKEPNPSKSESNTKTSSDEKSASEQADMSAQEKQQELDQWLRRIPDEPGGLLRRKFFIESRRKQTQVPEQTW